ncbi:MAG: amidohydrolase family protein [Phycisphaerae bacterium]
MLSQPNSALRQRVARAARSFVVRGLAVAFAAVAAWLVVAPRAVRAQGADPPPLIGPVAITNVTLVSAPGRTIERATVVMESGRIVAAGADVTVPAGARVLDGSNLHAYAGFIDGFTRTGVKEIRPAADEERRVEDEFENISEGPRARMEAANRNGIFAQRRAEELLDVLPETYADARAAGFTAALIAPPRSVLGGQAALLALGDEPVRRGLIRVGVAQTASLSPPGERALRDRGRYPSTTFGVIAHLRQVLSDAAWHEAMRGYVAKNPEHAGDLPVDADLDALQDVRKGGLPVYFEADDAAEIHRVLDLAAELRLRAVIVGGREAYKVIDRLKSSQTPVIVSLRVPAKPDEYKFDAGATRKAPDDTTLFGKNWSKRPFEPRAAYDEARRVRDEWLHGVKALEEAGVTWCITTHDQRKPADALGVLRAAIEAGLPADAALRALTLTPAKLFGTADIGAVERGKRASLTILTKPFSDKDAKVRWVFVDGAQHELDVAAGPRDRRRPDAGAAPGGPGRGRARRDAAPANAPAAESERGHDPHEGDGAPSADTQPAASRPTTEPAATQPTPRDDLYLHEPTWAIETDRERDPGFKTNGAVLLRNGTVLTVSGDDLPNCDVLVMHGKIEKIGPHLAAPAGVTTIDVGGCVLMPGVFDGHSHIALDSVNEGANSVTPEVRCADVVRPDDLQIYRALAGGTTTIHAMHGSANTIGGQCVLMKLKYGRPAAAMILHDAPRTVKFATGENVKRGGLPTGRFGAEGRVRRFPGSRMGVEGVMRRALYAGRQYLEDRAAYEAEQKAGRSPPPFRRDLRLEALADIVSGDLWVNSHCYRADEILRLLSVAEDFGFRVANLHHVLDGYRIIPEIAAHGCGTLTFSDWWAYKVEAYEAVPQNAGMLLRSGVNSAIKSDSSDLIRHMPLEAAKCMRYSGLSANEALRLVTLNPARQFALDGRIGSLEVGKDGDIAVYDGHPLDTFSKCVLTFIEGEVYFRHRDFAIDATRQPAPPRRMFESYALAGSGVRPVATVVASPPATAGGGVPGARGGAAGSNGSAGSNGAVGVDAAHTYAIVNATLHAISEPAIERGTLVIENGKIVAIGPTVQPPPGATIVDAAGGHVYPGFINAASTVGLSEIGQVDVTNDTSEPGTYQPDMRAISAFNPDSAMVEVARAEGITTILLVPDSPSVPGQAGLLDLAGWTMPEMLIEAEAGLVVNLPSGRATPIIDRERRTNPEFDEAEDRDRESDERVEKSLRNMRRLLENAKVYATAVRAARDQKAKPPVATDPRYDALAPYVLGEKPVLFSANGYKAILEALLFADELALKPVILGGRDAWKLADVLARRDVPVIFDGTFAQPDGVPTVPGASEPWDAQYRAAGVLARAGVRFCIANRSASLAKLITTDIGFAVGHGLDPDAAVRALTLSAAEILGLADRYGSLEVGKVANVVICSDHPGQASNVIRGVFIRGVPISLESKHTRDAQKYDARPTPAAISQSAAPARPTLRGPASQTTTTGPAAQSGSPAPGGSGGAPKDGRATGSAGQ